MNEKKKICVVSMENHTDSLHYRISHRNHECYCKINNYDYFEVNDFSKYPARNHAHWYKYNVINDAMHNIIADYHLWLDMDAYFTNMDARLEQFIINTARIMMPKDCKGGRGMYDYGYCNGVILFRNSPIVRDYINELCSEWLYELGSKLKDANIIRFRDQEMMQMLNKIGRFKNIVTEIQPKSFHSFLPDKAHVNNHWQKGDCILHLPGMKNALREDILQKIGYNLETGEVGFNGL